MTSAADASRGSPPTWADVLALVARLDASGLADAEVVTEGLQIRVSRTALPTGAGSYVSVPDDAPTSQRASAVAAPAEPPVAHDGPVVAAPMLGVVYWRPAPDQPPFVSVGDRVEPDTTVAIIEVMKLMNPVTAGRSGVVAEVCVPDGQMVEFGEVLIRLQDGE